MTALSSITAVRPTLSTKVLLLPYGATIAAGQVVYVDSTGLGQLADSNASSTTANAKGIAITPGVNGGYGYVAVGGSIILVGTTMGVGTSYYAGQTAGTIDDASVSGDYVTTLGTAASATQLDLNIKATGTLHA